jgi:hypothetical protein
MRFERQNLSLWVACLCVAGVMAGDGLADAQGETLPPFKDMPDGEKVKPAQAAHEGLDAPGVVDDDERAAPGADAKPSKKPVTANPFQKQTDELWRCRYQAARKQRVAPARIRGGRVLVRFTVNTKGQTTNTTVVAMEPADTSLLTCVKQEILQWRLVPLPKEPIAVETEVSLAVGARSSSGQKAEPPTGATVEAP